MSERHYLTGKEIRQIAKDNAKEMRLLEKNKNRKCKEEEFLSAMNDPNNILEVEDLHSYFYTDQGIVKAVNGVSFSIPINSTIGVVGESGCGKSVTAMSIMRLLQGPSGQIKSGSIRFRANDFKKDALGNYIPIYEKDEDGNIVKIESTDKKGNKTYIDKVKCDESGLPLYEREEKVYDIAKMPIKEMYRVRGRQIAMVFQEPMTSLNPVFTIGNQLDEASMLHIPNITKELAKKRSIHMLGMVGIASPERIYDAFPHELSGGMRQRVMIAMALVAEPRLIIADEPVSALDVSIQAQVINLLNDLRENLGLTILFIAHNLSVVKYFCDRIAVMYYGKLMELATSEELFAHPFHPYTKSLLSAVPHPDPNVEKGRKRVTYNPQKDHDYSEQKPTLREIVPGHFVRCNDAEEAKYLEEIKKGSK